MTKMTVLEKKHKYITIQAGSYRVRFRSTKGREVRYFCIEKYPNQNYALAAAILYRDKRLKQLGMSIRLNYQKSPDLYYNKNKSHAIIGVYWAYNHGRDGWIGKAEINHKTHKRFFSINKYGNELAFLQACNFRHSLVPKLVVVNEKQMPVTLAKIKQYIKNIKLKKDKYEKNK